jgi:hypothetical protein
MFGEAGVIVNHSECGHVFGYCGECATWRFLRSDAQTGATDTQRFLDWRFAVEASMN